MATIHKEILIKAAPDQVWDAVRDVGALHSRLVPGFVVNTELLPGEDPPVRVVTFSSGATLEEVIVGVDESRRRLVWTVRSDRVDHHNGALQVLDAEPGWSRAVWIADVLPQAMADAFSPQMGAGLAAMKRHFEARA